MLKKKAEENITSSQTSPAVSRALDILELIASSEGGITSKELSVHLGIPLASTFRILKTLVLRDYIKKDTDANIRYCLGLKFLELTAPVAKYSKLIMIARPIMKNLAESSSQTVLLSAPLEKGVLLLDYVLPTPTANNIFMPSANEISPLNACASGKIFLSSFTNGKLSNILDNISFIRQTKNSIMDKQELINEIKLVKSHKYASDFEESTIGVGAIAMPIYNDSKKEDHRVCMASLELKGNISFYNNPDSFYRLLELCRSSAKTITKSYITL